MLRLSLNRPFIYPTSYPSFLPLFLLHIFPYFFSLFFHYMIVSLIAPFFINFSIPIFLFYSILISLFLTSFILFFLLSYLPPSRVSLTLILRKWNLFCSSNTDGRWKMGFNSRFKGVNPSFFIHSCLPYFLCSSFQFLNFFFPFSLLQSFLLSFVISFLFSLPQSYIPTLFSFFHSFSLIFLCYLHSFLHSSIPSISFHFLLLVSSFFLLSFFLPFIPFSCLSSFLSSSLLLSCVPSLFPPYYPSFFLAFSILPIRLQYKQISYINSFTYFVILLFVSLISILPFFSQTILTYIITFSIHSSS